MNQSFESIFGRLLPSVGPLFWVAVGLAVLVYFRPGILMSALTWLGGLVNKAPQATPVAPAQAAYPAPVAYQPPAVQAQATVAQRPVYVGGQAPVPLVPIFRPTPTALQATQTEDLSHAMLEVRQEMLRRALHAQQKADAMKKLVPELSQPDAVPAAAAVPPA